MKKRFILFFRQLLYLKVITFTFDRFHILMLRILCWGTVLCVLHGRYSFVQDLAMRLWLTVFCFVFVFLCFSMPSYVSREMDNACTVNRHLLILELNAI